MSDQPPITKAKTEHTPYVNHTATQTWSIPLMDDSGHRRSTSQVTVDSHNDAAVCSIRAAFKHLSSLQLSYFFNYITVWKERKCFKNTKRICSETDIITHVRPPNMKIFNNKHEETQPH